MKLIDPDAYTEMQSKIEQIALKKSIEQGA